MNDWDYDNAPTDPSHGGKLTAEMAKARIAELEAIAHTSKAMLDEIATAAGFGAGDTYSAPAIIARLKAK
jgi:hypothetical protein